jgi:hypothetical protein
VSVFVSRLGLAGLELDIELPDHISARQPAPVKLTLKNDKSWMPSFSVHLAGVEAFPADDAEEAESLIGHWLETGETGLIAIDDELLSAEHFGKVEAAEQPYLAIRAVNRPNWKGAPASCRANPESASDRISPSRFKGRQASG